MGGTPNPLSSQPSPTTPPSSGGGGFMNILRNRILPAVSQGASSLALMYGSPAVRQGAEMNIQNARQRQFDAPALQSAQANAAYETGSLPDRLSAIHTAAQKAEKDFNMEPGSFEEKLSQMGAEEKLKAGYSPTPAVINGQPTMATMTGPGQMSPVTPGPSSTPPQTSPATTGNAGTPGVPGWSLNGGAPPTPPNPIANAATAPPNAPPSVLPLTKLSPGPWQRDTNGQLSQSMYDQFGREVAPRPGMPAGAINAMTPNKTLIPYLPKGVDPTTAKQSDWATAANTYNTRESSNTHIQMVPQPDGSIAPVPVTSSTSTSRATAPATPGGANSPTPNAKPRASAGTPGATTGGKVPSGVSKAYGDYNGALTRQEVMDKSLPQALAGNQQAMINILANHLGMTAGIQKGARINQAMWNEAMTSTPWIQSVVARFGHTDQSSGDFVFDGPLSGVTIPPEALKQMVSLADDRVNAQYNQWQREIKTARTGYGMGSGPTGGGTNPATGGGGGTANVSKLASDLMSKYGIKH